MTKATRTVEFVADAEVPPDQFILRLAGEDVAGGTVNMLSQLTELFAWGSYDQVALHPTRYDELFPDSADPAG